MDFLSKEKIEITPQVKNFLDKEQLLYIDGQWQFSIHNKNYTTINPATEQILATVQEAEIEDVDLAVAAARNSFEEGEWRETSLEDRRETLKRLGDLILENRETLAILETLDTGKPIRESYEGDIFRAAKNFHFFADYTEEMKDLVFQSGEDTHTAFREPLGVAALVTPWNLPLYLETWKIAPALLMGNSIVLKPSELTPLTASYFTHLVHTSGLLPKGVFNLVHGFGEKAAGETLVSHKRIDAISFTGETGTGRAIMRSAATGPTRVSFELGGKGASLLFDSCDLDLAVSEVIRAGFRNQGQICLATPRILISEKIYDAFKEKLLNAVKNIKVGDPLSPSTTMGALIGKDHYGKVTSYLNKIEPPAKMIYGGKRPNHLPKGYFLEPTIIEGVGDKHPISCEEIFGPVISLHKFKTEEEAIRLTNATPYGLSASVYSTDEKQIERVTRAIRIGLVWVNCWFARDLRVPFGGQKKSGIGREGGKWSLDFYSEWKSVCVRKHAK